MEINLVKSESNSKEILEMIMQFLHENKLNKSGKLLCDKANIIFDQNEIQQLKTFLTYHQFDEAINFIEKSNFENAQKNDVLTLIKSRKYIELVKSGVKEKALEFLRTEISQIHPDQKVLNKFTILLFQNNPGDLEKQLNANFSEISNDEALIKKIQSLLCLSLDSNGNRILPNNRLETMLNAYVDLINHVSIEKENVINNQGFLNINNKNFLRFDNQLIIEKHDDEVWLIEFSNDNKYFATCCRKGNICIFSQTYGHNSVSIECINSFSAHRKYITSMKWSYNQYYFLLTCSEDKQIKLWNALEGKCLKTFLIHLDIVTSVLWLSEDTFISGSIDKKMLISTIPNIHAAYQPNLSANQNISSKIICSETFLRVRDLLLSNFINCVAIIPASMNDIIFYNFKEFREVYRLNEPDPIISANLSKSDDGRFMITNVSRVNASISLYDLSTFSMINKYYGHTQDQYIIKCSFAGSKDEFIVCGSEDASIYLWHRSNSIPINIIKGHTGALNCVNWLVNEQYSVLFSVSDDHTLRIWTSNDMSLSYSDLTSKEMQGKKQGKESESVVNFLASADIEMSEANDSENEGMQGNSQEESDEHS